MKSEKWLRTWIKMKIQTYNARIDRNMPVKSLANNLLEIAKDFNRYTKEK